MDKSTFGNVAEVSGDVLLLRRIEKRDQLAVGELYDKHASSLYTIILRIVREQEEAEDILQDVFFRVWDRASLYKESLGSPFVWMMRIARNLSIDRLRSKLGQTRRMEVELHTYTSLHADDRMSNPERAAVNSQERQAIVEALATLPPDQRNLIECAYFQGFTQSEMAEQFNIPLGTIKTRIRAGMIELRRQLEHLMKENS